MVTDFERIIMCLLNNFTAKIFSMNSVFSVVKNTSSRIVEATECTQRLQLSAISLRYWLRNEQYFALRLPAFEVALRLGDFSKRKGFINSYLQLTRHDPLEQTL